MHPGFVHTLSNNLVYPDRDLVLDENLESGSYLVSAEYLVISSSLPSRVF